jgi:hypothetical protein
MILPLPDFAEFQTRLRVVIAQIVALEIEQVRLAAE